MNMGIVAGLIKAMAPGVDPQVIEQAVTDWLDDHPEATTTVQDGSITEEKLAQDVLTQLGEIEELKEAIEKKVGNSELYDGASVVARCDEIEIGATTNNDGGSTYIYHDLATFNCTEGKTVGIIAEDVQGAISTTPIFLYFLDSQNTEISVVYFSVEQLKVGRVAVAPTGTAKAKVRFYASTSGGLTETNANYKNVVVFLSEMSAVSVKPFYNEQFPIPSYYLEDGYIDGKLNAIRQAMETAEGNYDAFIFATDIHWSLNTKKSPNLISYISKRVPIPRMFIGGDIEDGINIDANRKLRTAFDGKCYFTVGNHEYMNALIRDGVRDTTVNVTDATIWAFLNGGMTDCVVGNPARNYYYVDNTVQKIRYIVLNDFGDGSEYQFEANQKSWFASALSGMQNGYTAVIFIHVISSIDHTTGELIGDTAFSDVQTIVDSYSGGGDVACIIAGHTHFDGMGSTSGGTPIFISTCDKAIPFQNADTWLSNTRTEGTITEQAFDVFVVDKKNNTVSAIRIGCAADNPTGTPLEVRTAEWGAVHCTSVTLDKNTLSFDQVGDTETITATLAPANTTDTLTWLSSDENVATVVNGVVTIHGIGTATITATCGNASATATINQSSIKAEGEIKFLSDTTLSSYVNTISASTLADSYVVAKKYTNRDDLRIMSAASRDFEAIPVPYGATKIKVETESGNAFTLNYMHLADMTEIITVASYKYPEYIQNKTLINSKTGGDVSYGQCVAFKIAPAQLNNETPIYVYFE